MDDFYTVSVNSDPKHGLGLLASDSETFRSPALCTEFDNEQLLALDDPQSFYLPFPDTGIFGHCDEALSRTSSAVTPQSECSTRTTLSAQNVSPTSDISPFQDKPSAQDIEAMYYDTTQSIISGRSSRATSATWPNINSSQAGLNSTLTSAVRTVPHRPQSFSYRTPQIAQPDAITPPPPSSFFPSPNLQAQAASSRSPFLSSNAHSPLMPQMSQLSSQSAFVQPSVSPSASSYYAQAQPQPQALQQALQQNVNPVFLAQLQQQLQQQHTPSLQQPQSQHRSIQNNLHAQPQLGTTMFPYPQLTSQSNSQSSLYNTSNSNHPPTSLPTPPALPNTTGNSSTGYQCFSHGCGGRHFSNWGNLVRHHRERQLRSKAGAKPTCPRCGKGFTRSSARDAHVAGLKCVLGRRRRGGPATNGATNTNASSNNNGTSADVGKVNASSNLREADGEAEELQYYAGQRIKGEGLDDQNHDHDHDHDNDNDNGSEGSREDGGEDEDDMDLLDGDKRIDHHHERDAVADMLGLSGDAGQAYLAPEQLHFTL